MSDSENKGLNRALNTVDENRRSFMRKVVLTTAFTLPIVSSFAIDGMMVSSALATPNSSNAS